MSLEQPSGARSLIAELDRLETALAGGEWNDGEREELAARLRVFAKKWAAAEPAAGQGIEQNLYRANDDELYRLIDESLSE